ncbi:MAG: RpiB/LacA/LacB family sugar-phosphate isomerase [Candidatus Nomurabacteria bacterium]|jgi:ribose 5-phosphate isomerase B|nr:RpiB/LacA/LacB family sugar-phosphate isomerase [Candidatus Nomurabacteria bacterium]
MRIYLGADHRGFELKNEIVGWLKATQKDYVDLGAFELLPEDDYNDYTKSVVQEILKNPEEARGVLLCGSAQGMCMQANRFKGIRAAHCHNATEMAESRSHNDANIVCIPADELVDYAAIIDALLETEFLTLEKYIRRNRKLDEE